MIIVVLNEVHAGDKNARNGSEQVHPGNVPLIVYLRGWCGHKDEKGMISRNAWSIDFILTGSLYESDSWY